MGVKTEGGEKENYFLGKKPWLCSHKQLYSLEMYGYMSWGLGCSYMWVLWYIIWACLFLSLGILPALCSKLQGSIFTFLIKKKIPLYHCFLGICVSSVHLSWMYYNAILTLSTQSYCQIPNLRSKSFISCLISLTPATGQSSPSHPHFQNTGYRFKGYCDPLRCDMVHLKWVTDLRNVLYLLHFHYEKYT